MLRSLKDLEHYAVNATDGDVGTVVDFLLDDERWTVRWLVAQLSGMEERRVLVSPMSFGSVDWTTQRFQVALTAEKVNHSPSIDTDKPVTRQHESDYHEYYNFPNYWGYSGLWGAGWSPGSIALEERPYTPAPNADGHPSDSHLRSASELRGYHIHGSDDRIGRIADFIIDDETWQVRYVVVDTSDWWFGKKVLVAPEWAERISWYDREVHLSLSREAIKASPEWNPNAPINRKYEAHLYDYYGRPVYWATGPHANSVVTTDRAER